MYHTEAMISCPALNISGYTSAPYYEQDCSAHGVHQATNPLLQIAVYLKRLFVRSEIISSRIHWCDQYSHERIVGIPPSVD
jgi:hypothetical protein